MQTPEQLTEQLKDELADDLRSVILYGSAASGDRTRRYSDYNVLIVVNDPSPAVLRRVMPYLKRWRKDGNRAPLFFSESRFRQAADVFPIEFSDMKRQHRVLWGAGNLFDDIHLDRAHLRHQLEYELRSKLILLRQSYLDSGGRPAALRPILAHALSAFAVLFKTVLDLVDQPIPTHKPEVWSAVSSQVPIDVGALDAIWKMREGDRDAERRDPDDLFSGLVSSVEAVVDFVDRHGTNGTQGRNR